MESTITNKNTFQLNEKIREYLIQTICLVCLFLFLFAAYGKLAEHQTFVQGLRAVSFIGTYAGIISWLVPIAEIMVSLLLIIPITYKWGLYGFTGLMLVFTVYIGSMLLWNENLPCHCNLFVENLSWVEHLWFNMGFICLSVIAILLGKSSKTKNQNNEQH